jgi:hypothetical protein
MKTAYANSSPGSRPQRGDLIAVFPDGRVEVLAAGKPFALLQHLKRQHTAQNGVKIKITYTGNHR